jgi:hypothetical protein
MLVQVTFEPVLGYPARRSEPPATSLARLIAHRASLRSLWPASLATVALAAFLVGATPAAGGDATTNARAPARVTRLAWFFMRNTDDTSPSTLVARSAVMILSGSDREVGFLQKVRRAGWKKPILEYIQGPHAMGPSTALNRGGSCPASYESFTTSWTSRAGDFCNRVHPNESWFLHNGAGQRLYEDGGDGNFWFLMNPASAGWRNYVASKVPQIASDYRMDGLFLDNVWATTWAPRTRETNSDGTCRECGSDAEWRKANLGFLRAVKRARSKRPVWINSDNSSAFVRAVDGGMIENMGASWGSSFMPQSEIESRWRDIDRNVAARRSMLLVGQGDSRSEIERMRFAHAVYLMVAGPRVSFRFQNAGNYRELWDYPEYRLRMGMATGPRRRVSRSVWRRKFTAGVSVVNLSENGSQRVSLGGTYMLPDGLRVTSVTLGPHEGIAAVRAGKK